MLRERIFEGTFIFHWYTPLAPVMYMKQLICIVMSVYKGGELYNRPKLLMFNSVLLIGVRDLFLFPPPLFSGGGGGANFMLC